MPPPSAGCSGGRCDSTRQPNHSPTTKPPTGCAAAPCGRPTSSEARSPRSAPFGSATADPVASATPVSCTTLPPPPPGSSAHALPQPNHWLPTIGGFRWLDFLGRGESSPSGWPRPAARRCGWQRRRRSDDPPTGLRGNVAARPGQALPTAGDPGRRDRRPLAGRVAGGSETFRLRQNRLGTHPGTGSRSGSGDRDAERELVRDTLRQYGAAPLDR